MSTYHTGAKAWVMLLGELAHDARPALPSPSEADDSPSEADVGPSEGHSEL